MASKETAIAVVTKAKLPKKVQDRLIEKMLDMNDTKIIEKIQQRNAHIEAIAQLDKDIEKLCSLNME